LFFLHDKEKALEAYRRAASLDPDNAQVWKQLYYLVMRIGDLDESAKENIATNDFTAMSGAEIRSSLIGNTLDGFDEGGHYVVYYPSYGTMKFRSLRTGFEDVGVWHVNGDRYCRKWTIVGHGHERCVTFLRCGEHINWVRENGSVGDRMQLRPGNPAGL
jgi:hypothetical protein